MKQQSGFTLIELIMVIVVLAALAVTAIPRYVNLQAQAITGALNGVAGSLASGTAINFAACAAGGACLPMANCTNAADALVGSAVPAGYLITPAALGASGTITTCTLTHSASSQTTTFSAIAP